MAQIDEKKVYTEHHEGLAGDLEYRGDGVLEKDTGRYLQDAMEAVHEQKTQNFKSAFAQYKPAMMWSIIFSSGEQAVRAIGPATT
jgi:hypothetical protein